MIEQDLPKKLYNNKKQEPFQVESKAQAVAQEKEDFKERKQEAIEEFDPSRVRRGRPKAEKKERKIKIKIKKSTPKAEQKAEQKAEEPPKKSKRTPTQKHVRKLEKFVDKLEGRLVKARKEFTKANLKKFNKDEDMGKLLLKWQMRLEAVNSKMFKYVTDTIGEDEFRQNDAYLPIWKSSTNLQKRVKKAVKTWMQRVAQRIFDIGMEKK